MNIDEKYEKLEELEKYAELEETELGEFCAGLCSIARSDMMSDEFELAVEKEIDFQLDNFKTNSKIVETEETFTHTLVYLEGGGTHIMTFEEWWEKSKKWKIPKTALFCDFGKIVAEIAYEIGFQEGRKLTRQASRLANEKMG